MPIGPILTWMDIELQWVATWSRSMKADFFAGDGYTNDAHWTEAGKHWRDTRRTLWPSLANEPDSAPLVIPNQPAIGVTWYEAQALCNRSSSPFADAQ